MVNLKVIYPQKGNIYRFKPVNIEGRVPIFKVHYIPEFVISKEESPYRFYLCETEFGYEKCKFCELSQRLNESGDCFKIREFLKQINFIRNDKQFDLHYQYIGFLPAYFYNPRLRDFEVYLFYLNESLLEQFYNFIEENKLFEITDVLNNKQAIEVKVSDKSVFYFDYLKIIENIDLAFPIPFLKTYKDVEKDVYPIYKTIYEEFNLRILNIENDYNTLQVIYNLLEKRIKNALNKISQVSK